REERAASNSNQPENANTAPESNSNSNANENVDTPPPADHDQVLGQLTNLEQEWMAANINADKRKLEHILADDYVAQDEKGRLQSKADYIRTIRRDTEVDKWEFSNLKLNLVGDGATGNGIVTYVDDDPSVSPDFTDKSVSRDGRWHATASVTNGRGTPELHL